MSHDVRHVPWAYRLEGAPSLPLVGEQHPLRREFARWLAWASAAAIALGLAAFGLWTWWSQREPEAAPVAREIKIVRYTDLGVPPSIARPSAPQINVAQEVARLAAPPPAIAVPEPVADERATTETIATVSEMAEALAPVDLSDLGTGTGVGDSLVVDIDVDTSPAPDEFIAVDEEPQRISIDPPVYPDVARQAEIEGTVIVRVLVSKDGRAKDVIVIDGPVPLREAADRCARTSTWRPAIVDGKPIEVWVMMPVTFKLRN
ncbi:MAG TPA: energy transducer TonB [Candidatus Krumholzibacteria bacterium]|nr:energy transducer TonB [Candidatus Krumholzibacteria bacterium]HPD70555.1 energy transducer TonB [Candidatus Krumholzibacteria bacterium]HRY39745.1 energy transducer TonB [Candidatus Krumholzibacteria bacterium]